MNHLRSFVLALAALAPVSAGTHLRAEDATPEAPGTASPAASTDNLDPEAKKEMDAYHKQREKQLRKLKAASAVGYDGSAIERSTRKALDKVDANQRKAMEIGSQEP